MTVFYVCRCVFIFIFIPVFRLMPRYSNIRCFRQPKLLAGCRKAFSVSVCVGVTLVGFPQSPLQCKPACTSILLWQLSGAPWGAPATHSTAWRPCVLFFFLCTCVTVMTTKLCKRWHKHRPHNCKDGHASPPLTYVESQHLYDAIRKSSPLFGGQSDGPRSDEFLVFKNMKSI